MDPKYLYIKLEGWIFHDNRNVSKNNFQKGNDSIRLRFNLPIHQGHGADKQTYIVIWWQNNELNTIYEAYHYKWGANLGEM